MCVNRGVPGRTGQVLAVAVGDMLACFRVSEALGEPEIYHVHVVLLLADADQEVVRLYVPVQEVAGVDKFDALKLQ